MENFLLRKLRYLVPVLVLITAGMVGTAAAVTYDLQAGVITKTMPDGRVVTMWGFGPPTTDPLVNPITVPGPELVIPEGDTELIINLTNNLPVPVSIIIPGQPPGLVTLPGQAETAAVPTWTDGTTGPRTNVTQRVRSLTLETPAAIAGIPPIPGTATYRWTGLKPGTYLYKSGTHQQVQVPMGLYGAMRKDAGIAGQAYTPTANNPNTSYNAQVTLLFSEVDPDLNDSIVTGNYAGIPATPGAPVPATAPTALTSTIGYHGKYFLINGEPFSYSRSPIIPTPAAAAGQRILLRFLNAGNEDYVPVLQGIYMEVLAEDGNLYPFPKNQYSLLLAAGRSIDATITPATIGYIPLYDRRIHLTNAATSPGGMLAYLSVGAVNQLTVALAGTGTGRVVTTALPGGIDCSSVGLVDCTENYVAGTTISLTAIPDPGVSFGGWTGVDPGTELLNPGTVTMNGDKNVTATFGPGGVGGLITLTSPNGGETFRRRTTIPITWTFTGDPGALVSIQLLQGTSVRRNITAGASIGTGGTGSFNWRIPRFFRRLGSNFRIVITSTTNPAATDTSDNTFTITR